MNPESEIVVGSRVHLRSYPHGEPGIVAVLSKGRAHVDWCDLGMTTSHSVERLQLASFDNHFVLERGNGFVFSAQHQAVGNASATGILERQREETGKCGSTGF